MAQKGDEEEEQSKKRKKWSQNLSVISSEDENDTYTGSPYKEENPNILENDEAIYLRFPYYMGSDDSDDDNNTKNFSEIFPGKRDQENSDSSLNETIGINKENHSYKHTKRKLNNCMRKSSNKNLIKETNHSCNELENNILLDNRKYKNSSNQMLKCKDSKSSKKLPIRKKYKNTMCYSHKYSENNSDSSSTDSGELNIEIEKTPKKIHRRIKPLQSTKSTVKTEENHEAKQTDDEFLVRNIKSRSKFLDSSSEDSSMETNATKPKPRKHRRVYVLPSSPSSSDGECDQNISDPSKNLKPAENSYTDEVQAGGKLVHESKPAASLSSEEEGDGNDLLFEASKERSGKEAGVVENLAARTSPVDIGTDVQTKTQINTSAWKSIAIADIKAQHNKQSKVEELKRKFATSNTIASSISIYKNIQKREMLKNTSGFEKPISRPKPFHNHSLLHHKTNSREIDGIPSSSTSQKHDQSFVNSTGTQLVERDSKISRPNVHLSIPGKCDAHVKVLGESAENLQSTNFDLQHNEDCNCLDCDGNMHSYGKKIRHAHNHGSKSQNIPKYVPVSQSKIPNQTSKQTYSSKENKSKESKKTEKTSTSYDILGNIMSQMDKNPYKIQKPLNKKPDPTPEMLGWFPVGSNASSSSVLPQNATGLQLPWMDDPQLKQNLPIVNAFNSNNIPNPSYNPLYSAVLNDSRPICNKAECSDLKPKSQEDLKGVKSKQATQTNENIAALLTPAPKTFVPFYSAPHQDYRSNNLRTKNLGTNPKSNMLSPSPRTNITENQDEVCINNRRQSSDSKSNNSLSKSSRKCPISQKPNDSQLVHTNILSKSLSSTTNASVNSYNSAQGNTNQLLKNKSEKNIFEPLNLPIEPLKDTLSKSQPPLSLQNSRGNDKIQKELKNNNPTKGIRVRFSGTEYRLPVKTSDICNSKEGEVREKQSERDHTKQISSSNIKSSSAAANKTEQKNNVNLSNVAKGSDKPQAKAVVSSPITSSSSTSSTSSTNTSENSSSSESSDESSSYSSTHSGSRADSPNHCALNDVTGTETQKPSIQTNNSQPQTNLQENIKLSPVGIALNVVPDPPNQSEGKNTSLTLSKEIHDVITLSSSSDSDSNNQEQRKAIDFQRPGEVSKSKEPTDNKLGCLGESNSGKTASQGETSKQNSSKVGTIRVKSLKELGIAENNSGIENALTREDREVQLQTQIIVNQMNQSDTLSSSNGNTVGDNVNPIKEVVSNLPPDKTISHPGLLRTDKNKSKSLKKVPNKPKKPTSTILLPVVPVAVINPTNSVKVRPMFLGLNPNNVRESNSNCGNQNVTFVKVPNATQTTASGTESSTNQDVSQNSTSVVAIPCPTKDMESCFFKLCDELFTEVILFKIPKLADDLHLIIAHDVMRQERLKRIDQLRSAETIASEKRRAEKEFADMIKIRGQSFVPLFATIMNKIEKKNIKSSVIAVYCKIVHQLEMIDPINRVYRFKLRLFIKTMLQKYSSSVNQDVLSYFESESEDNFMAHFDFIEDLLKKYDKYVAERQETVPELQNENDATNTSQPVSDSASDITDSVSSAILSTEEPHSSRTIVNSTNQTTSQNLSVPVKPPPPLIGNLDKIFFFKGNFSKK